MPTAVWKRELASAYRSLDDLRRRFPRMRITPAMRKAEATFPMAVSPYYASLIRKPDFSDPVFAQCVPNEGELIEAPWLSGDPLGEIPYSVTPRLVHRYKDRALLLVTSACATYCRHCTRKRVSGCPDAAIRDDELAAACAYLRSHPAVCDVLVSGGDPLTLSDARIGEILAALRAVPSVRVIRLCTRMPVTLPSRITAGLVRILKPRRGQACVYLNTQFNHPREITPASTEACRRLIDAGIPVGSQTVLLRGVNDTPACIEELCRGLFQIRVRPYCLFQCDLVRGIEAFRTPLSTGLAIMKHLRRELSGMAIPNFCLDPPGEGGKIELTPDYVVRRSKTRTVLRNGAGETFVYPEPTIPPALHSKGGKGIMGA